MTFGIAGNLRKADVPTIAEQVIRRFNSEGISYIVEKSLAELLRKKLKVKSIGKAGSVRDLTARCDMLVSLGGDGTILQLARNVAEKGTPLLGVNLGKLGFLAEVSVEDLDACLTEILKGEYSIVERMMLQATILNSSKTYIALNDIVVDKFGSSRVLNFETHVNGEYLATFTADGIILSTPTGSTAYAMANGGPIVAPHNRAITINPICPHSLTVRPVIVPDDSVIRIKVASSENRVHVTADGQDEILVNPPTEIRIKRSPFTARLVKRRNTSYYDLLRKKLNWGQDLRTDKK
jgi:NAD+ kinase